MVLALAFIETKNKAVCKIIKKNLAGIVLGWSLFNIVSDSAALNSKWHVSSF
jgi:hypothetical protein